MPILNLNIYLIAFFLCTNGISAVMWYVKSNDAKTYKAQVVSCQEERKFFEMRVRTAGELAERRIAIEKQKHEQVTKEVAREYQNRLDSLRADYRLRQRSTSAGSSGVQSFPVAPARIDEVPANALPVAEQCAETTLMLVELQDWIRQVQ